jgi:hypothetical protein
MPPFYLDILTSANQSVFADTSGCKKPQTCQRNTKDDQNASRRRAGSREISFDAQAADKEPCSDQDASTTLGIQLPRSSEVSFDPT